MKKFILVLMVSGLFVSCTGNTNVDKVDEKGHNPSPEQIIIVQECADSVIIVTEEFK